MNQIYYSCDSARMDQFVHATMVADSGGARFRITIRWDKSYSNQTHGEIAVLDGLEFKPLLRLHAHEMPELNKTIGYAAVPDLASAVWKQAKLILELGATILRAAP